MSRIALHLDHSENQQLLAAELREDHDIVVPADDDGLDGAYDLLVLDGRSLDRLWERVGERKVRERPIFLPVLLVTSRPNVKMITRHLWRSVDELIITPIEKPELRARVHILLRARQWSLELRERMDAAERAARMRDEVMAMVSHDLRNPLNVVLSYTSMLLETASALEEAQQEQLRTIHRAVSQMERLTVDLLDISGLESGQLRIQTQAVSAARLLAEARALHAQVAARKSVCLAVEAEEPLAPVRADADRVHQLLGNLIGNAIKFTPAGGSVVLAARSAPAGVRFSVSDSGPGVPEEDHERVFDRFWQAQRSRDGGAGLGLAIARSIAEAHGGRIGVRSADGEGAEFWFELPLAEAEE